MPTPTDELLEKLQNALINEESFIEQCKLTLSATANIYESFLSIKEKYNTSIENNLSLGKELESALDELKNKSKEFSDNIEAQKLQIQAHNTKIDEVLAKIAQNLESSNLNTQTSQDILEQVRAQNDKFIATRDEINRLLGVLNELEPLKQDYLDMIDTLKDKILEASAYKSQVLSDIASTAQTQTNTMLSSLTNKQEQIIDALELKQSSVSQSFDEYLSQLEAYKNELLTPLRLNLVDSDGVIIDEKGAISIKIGTSEPTTIRLDTNALNLRASFDDESLNEILSLDSVNKTLTLTPANDEKKTANLTLIGIRGFEKLELSIVYEHEALNLSVQESEKVLIDKQTQEISAKADTSQATIININTNALKLDVSISDEGLNEILSLDSANKTLTLTPTINENKSAIITLSASAGAPKLELNIAYEQTMIEEPTTLPETQATPAKKAKK